MRLWEDKLLQTPPVSFFPPFPSCRKYPLPLSLMHSLLIDFNSSKALFLTRKVQITKAATSAIARSCSWPHSRRRWYLPPLCCLLLLQAAGPPQPGAEGTTFLLLKHSPFFPHRFPHFPSTTHAGVARLIEALNSRGPSSYLPLSFRALADCSPGKLSWQGGDCGWRGEFMRKHQKLHKRKKLPNHPLALKAAHLHSKERGGKGRAPLSSTARTGARSHGWAEQHWSDTRKFANRISHNTVFSHFLLLCCPSNTTDGQPWSLSQGPLCLTHKN